MSTCLFGFFYRQTLNYKVGHVLGLHFVLFLPEFWNSKPSCSLLLLTDHSRQLSGTYSHGTALNNSWVVRVIKSIEFTIFKKKFHFELIPCTHWSFWCIWVCIWQMVCRIVIQTQYTTWRRNTQSGDFRLLGQ